MRRTLVLLSLAAAGCASGGKQEGLTSTPGTPQTLRVHTDAGNYAVQSNADVRVSRQWVRLPPERVKAVLPGVYEALGLPMQQSGEGEALLFSNPGFSTNRRLAGERLSEYLNCGNTPIGAAAADVSTVTVQIATTVRGGAEGTELRTHMVGSAFPRAGGSGSGQPCSSTGKLEQRIATMVTERAGG